MLEKSERVFRGKPERILMAFASIVKDLSITNETVISILW